MGAIFAIVEMVLMLAIQGTILLFNEIVIPVASFLARVLFFAIGAYPKVFLIGGLVIFVFFVFLSLFG